MENKKTLIILSPGFAANEADSSCLPAQQALVRAVNKIYPQINCIIISFQYPYSKLPYQWFGNLIIPFDGQNKQETKNSSFVYRLWLKCKRIYLWIRIWRKLTDIKHKENVIGILSFWVGECAVLGHHFSRSKYLPHFSWILGQDAKAGNRYMKMMQIKGESLIAMSDFLSKTFEDNYGIKPRYTIPNGIDTSLFPNQLVERDIDIIGVGSLIPLKRYDLFVSLIQKIKFQFPALKVIICGKGTEQEKLEALIKTNDLQNTIQLSGEKKHEEVLQLMQRSKIMLHPSVYEGFSGACLEALYAGAHVISFCKAQKEEINHWHIVSTEQDMLEKALFLLHQNPDHSPSLPYSMDDTARLMMELFTG